MKYLVKRRGYLVSNLQVFIFDAFVNYIFVGTDRYTCSNDLRVRRTVSGHVAAGTRSERVKREGSSLSESGRVPWTRNYASPYLPLQRVLRWIFFELANLSLHPLISLFAPYVYSSFSAIDFAMETFFFSRNVTRLNVRQCRTFLSFFRFEFHSCLNLKKGNEGIATNKILKSFVRSFVYAPCIHSYKTSPSNVSKYVYRKKKYYFHRINSCLLDCSQQTTNLLRK